MPEEKTTAERAIAQTELVNRLLAYVQNNTDTRVPETISGEIQIGSKQYRIEGGEPMWLEFRSRNTFYVTLENQNAQLKIEVHREGLILTRRLLSGGSSVGARPRRPVSHSY